MSTTASASAIALSGLGGFDSSSVVSSLVAIAQAPVDAIETQIQNVDSAQTTYTGFSSSLASLKAAVDALSTTSGFVSMAATSDDSTIVGSVTGNAASGSYAVNVTQLASAEKMRSDAQASSTDPLGMSGTLTLQVGSGTAVNIDVSATDTLTNIASKIAQSGARVSAGIINAGGSYRLQLQGLDTGASNSISVTEGGSISLGLSNSANVVQTAKDANLTVDGLPITRSTNAVTDAIPGVTLALTKVSTTPANVTVSSSASGVEGKIQTLVSAYNAIVSGVHSATGYGTTAATNSVLQADPTMRGVLNNMSSIIAGLVPGTTGKYSSLASAGLTLGTDGTLALNTTTFEAALADNPQGVSALFVTDGATGATGLMATLSKAIDGFSNTTNGLIKARTDALTSEVTTLQKSHDDKQSQVDDYQTQLNAQYANLNAEMSKYNEMESELASIGTS